jgi:hypothetical protein
METKQHILEALDSKEKAMSKVFTILCEEGWKLDKQDAVDLCKELAYALAGNPLDQEAIADIKENLTELFGW